MRGQEHRASKSKCGTRALQKPAGVACGGERHTEDQRSRVGVDVLFVFEGGAHMWRVVYTDGRKHTPPDRLNPTYLGEGVGRWEGDTLVVDDVGFNTRSWLDAVVFEAVALSDAAPGPGDFTGAVDSAPAPSDLLTAPLAPLVEQRVIAPVYNRHYYHIGITYGANEPAVADSGVVANGVPISANG